MLNIKSTTHKSMTKDKYQRIASDLIRTGAGWKMRGGGNKVENVNRMKQP